MAINRLKAGVAGQGESSSWKEKLSWLSRSLSLLFVVALITGVIWGGQKVFHKLDVPIGVISIKGQFSYVDQGEVQRRVEPLVDGRILSLNLGGIRRQLELHPWIEQATVSRQWPGGLVITVKEEVPIARWGKTGFLNSRGEMLEIPDNSILAHLPLLQGGVNTERSLMKAYREIAQLLQPSSLKIASLKRDERGAWQLSLVNGLALIIGRDQVMEKMRRFLVVWTSTLKGKAEQIVSVDIRYDNGIAVQWDKQSIDEKNKEEQSLQALKTKVSNLSGKV
jgi:cell division protein FtsQ